MTEELQRMADSWTWSEDEGFSNIGSFKSILLDLKSGRFSAHLKRTQVLNRRSRLLIEIRENSRKEQNLLESGVTENDLEDLLNFHVNNDPVQLQGDENNENYVSVQNLNDEKVSAVEEWLQELASRLGSECEKRLKLNELFLAALEAFDYKSFKSWVGEPNLVQVAKRKIGDIILNIGGQWKDNFEAGSVIEGYIKFLLFTQDQKRTIEKIEIEEIWKKF